MNRNTTKKRLKYWHLGMIFYVLICFSGIVMIANVLSTKAAPSSYFAPPDTPGVTPTTPPVTPTTPPATPTPTTPAAQPTTPAAQPTTPAAQPTRNAVVLTPTPATTLATPTTTSTATGLGILPTSISVPPGQNATHTQLSSPSTGSNAGGPNMLALSLGISTSGIILFGGGLFWLYARRNLQGVVALQRGQRSGLTTNASWTNSGNRATGMGIPPALDTFVAATPPMAPSPYVNSPLLSSNKDMVSGANMVQQSILQSPAELAGPVYRPGMLQPITMALPKQASDQEAPDLTPYIPASDMNPLSFDAFNLPQDSTRSMPPEPWSNQPFPIVEHLSPARDMNPFPFDAFDQPQESTEFTPPEQWSSQPLPVVEHLSPARDMNSFPFDAFDQPQEGTEFTPQGQWSSQPLPVVENPALTKEINSSTATSSPNIPVLATTARLSVQPPDVADDRTLQEIMRQAQMGLFVLRDE